MIWEVVHVGWMNLASADQTGDGADHPEYFLFVNVL